MTPRPYGRSRQPAWTVTLVVAAVFAGLCLLFNVVIPAIGIHGLPDWLTDPRIMVPATVLLTAVVYAGLIDDDARPRRGERVWHHLTVSGAVAGVAFALLLDACVGLTLGLEAFIASTSIGVLLALFGAFGFVARGL